MNETRAAVSLPIELLRGYHALAGASNPIHVDYDSARQRGLRDPLAHGNLVIILIMQRFFRLVVGRALDSYEMNAKFIRPIYAGDAADIVFTESIGSENASREWVFSVRVSGTDCIVGTITVSKELEGIL